jgi:outer membrane protein OmpA-like peptidoglycan-associated protein
VRKSALILLAALLPLTAQESSEPAWWFGVAGAVNLNFYGGTTQQLNPETNTLAAFHKGFGTGLYIAPVIEYRPDPVWGGMLQIAYDDRRGKFEDAVCPCGEVGKLSARPAYLSIEPSLRYSPLGDWGAPEFHVFAGPRIAFLAPWGDPKTFEHTRVGISTREGEFSQMRGMVFSGQVGVGYDAEWSPANSRTRIEFTPFVSYQPRFGQNPRTDGDIVDRWGIETIRIGAVLKFGRAKAVLPPGPTVRFSVKAPAQVVLVRKIQETFPLRNYVYFDDKEIRFSSRYAMLTPPQAEAFREEQLQDSFPARPTGRTVRQLAIYRNILNIMGDRMRRNPATTIELLGLSSHGPQYGKARAETVKAYLVDVFGIAGSRIQTEGREQPPVAPGDRAASELEMLAAEDQRVEIRSESREMLVQIGEGAHFMLKPVEIRGETPGTDSVVFHAPGAEALGAWELEIRDLPLDTTQAPRRLGPYTGNRVALPAGQVLAGAFEGAYRATLVGTVEAGRNGQNALVIRRDASFRLSSRHAGVHQINRFAILFDIDQAKAVSSYERFLDEVVTARIPDSGGVTIRGRTDIVGKQEYNLKLSRDRALGVQEILQSSTAARGRRGVVFKPTWSGEDPKQAPFGNTTPEERNYNRTVIIDILPE